MKNMTIALSLIMIAVLSCPTQGAFSLRTDFNTDGNLETWTVVDIGTGSATVSGGVLKITSTDIDPKMRIANLNIPWAKVGQVRYRIRQKVSATDTTWLVPLNDSGLGFGMSGNPAEGANNWLGNTYRTVIQEADGWNVIKVDMLAAIAANGWTAPPTDTDGDGLWDSIRLDPVGNANLYAEVDYVYVLYGDYNISGTTNPSPVDNALGVTSPIQFSWDSVYAGAGQVSQYTLYMDTDEAKVSQETPPAGLLISGAAVTPALTSPFTGAYTYNGALINDQEYFWRADTLIYEPNNADPNNIVYNIPVKVKGDVYSFTGPLSIPLLTGPSDVVIQPDPLTHVFGNTNAVFTADILCSAAITNVQWFKEGNAAPIVDDDVNYNIEFSQTQTTLTVVDAQTTDNGKYYCKVFTADTNTESSHALLYRQLILKHRYSFSGNLVDSVSAANGTLINNGGTWASVTASELVLANTGQVSGDANSINTAGGYVQLPANIIQPMGEYGTFVVWFTSTDAANTASQRLFAFGDPGVQPFNPVNAQYVSLQSNPQMAFITDSVGTGNEKNLGSGNTVATANTQFCLVGRLDGAVNTQTVFVDGVQKGIDTSVTFDFFGLTDTTNYIGRSMNPTQPLFIGKINEIRIYDVALTNAWIKAIYEAGPDNLNANPCNTPQGTFDYNGDCVVDMEDFAIYAQKWPYCGLLSCN